MCRKYLRIRIVAFVLTSMLGLSVVDILGQEKFAGKDHAKIKPCKANSQLTEGSGISSGDIGYPYGVSSENAPIKKNLSPTRPLKIISKPRAKYTDEARQNCVEGIVVLRITFFANGNVGNFKVMQGLNYGLSERAITAAKQIKFEPATKKNRAVTVTKKIQYNFTIY